MGRVPAPLDAQDSHFEGDGRAVDRTAVEPKLGGPAGVDVKARDVGHRWRSKDESAVENRERASGKDGYVEVLRCGDYRCGEHARQRRQRDEATHPALRS